MIPVEVNVIKGHDHWYYDRSPAINKESWEFLKQHSLAGERRHVEYNSNNEASDATAALARINSLRSDANKLITRFSETEGKLNGLDISRDKDAIAKIVREQTQMLSEGARLFRDAADVADRATRLNLTSGPREYFSLVLTASNKRAEALDLVRQRAELLVSAVQQDTIDLKRDELVKKANGLNDEATVLEKKAEKILGQKN
jgi:hypothetical protein